MERENPQIATNEDQPSTEIELAPKRGTLAWLQLQEHVEWYGTEIPIVNRLPEGATRYDGEDDGRCRVTHPDGRRCGASRTHLYGICSAHAGGGDPEAASALGTAQRVRLKERRMLLGIGANQAANPRQIARMAAQQRAEEIAAALIDAPLDDRELGTMDRQSAVLRGLDATFPLQQLTVELELPADPEQVQGMGWQEMQTLAARLLTEG